MDFYYDFGEGDFEYEAEYEDVKRELLKLLTDDMLDSYCKENNLNKQTDKEEVEKVRKIIAFTFENYDMGIDEFINWEEAYESELKEIFEHDAMDEYRDAEASKDMMSYNGLHYSDFI